MCFLLITETGYAEILQIASDEKGPIYMDTEIIPLENSIIPGVFSVWVGRNADFLDEWYQYAKKGENDVVVDIHKGSEYILPTPVLPWSNRWRIYEFCSADKQYVTNYTQKNGHDIDVYVAFDSLHGFQGSFGVLAISIDRTSNKVFMYQLGYVGSMVGVRGDMEGNAFIQDGDLFDQIRQFCLPYLPEGGLMR